MAIRSLLCLSCRQPWADLIIYGLKPDVNRVWKSKYRGILLIHSSSHLDYQWESKLNSKLLHQTKKFLQRRILSSYGLNRPKRNRILGAVVMTDCTLHNISPWCETGMWHHHFVEPTKFYDPIPFHKGQLHHFRYSELDRISARDIKQLNDLREKYKEICGMDLIDASSPPPPPQNQDPEHKKFNGMRRDPVTQKWIQDGTDPGHVTVRQKAAEKRFNKQTTQRDAEQRKEDSERISALNDRNSALSPVPSGNDTPEEKKRPHKVYRKRGRRAKRTKEKKPPKPKAPICKKFCEQFRPARYNSGFTKKYGPDTWPSCRLHEAHIRHIDKCDVYASILVKISTGELS